jgi:membrane protein YqaA with SNARE-associated domain
MALAISIPANAFRYAAICSLASVLGGVFGYGIGYYFMDSVGLQVVELYGLAERFDYLGLLYKEYDAWVVVIAGFTPIPYKVFTIAAGAFNVDLKVFIAASAFGRSLRFFIVAGLIFYYGKTIKAFIEKYFGILSILLVVGVILGFLVLKFFLGHG